MSVDESPMPLPVVTLTPAGIPQPTSIAATNALDLTRSLHRYYGSRDGVAYIAIMACIRVLDRTQFPQMQTRYRDDDGVEHLTKNPQVIRDFLINDYVDMLESWVHSPDDGSDIPRISDSFRASFAGVGKGEELELPESRAFFNGIDNDTDPILKDARRESLALSQLLSHAHIAVADADLCAVLAGATPGMDDLPLQPYDPLFDTGLLYLAQPLTFTGTHIRTINNEQPHLVAIAWHANAIHDGQPGVTFYPIIRFPDRPRRPGEPAPMAILPGFHWPYGSTVTDAYTRYTGLHWYQRFTDGHTRISGSGPLHDPIAERLTVAFWHLSRQRLTNTGTATPAKPARKKAARAHLKAADPDGIVLISLRHHTTSTHTGDDAEETATQRAWRARWMVRGHWRNQYYPSIKGHRPVYIHPYLKGPEDLPVSGAQRVWVSTGTGLSA